MNIDRLNVTMVHDLRELGQRLAALFPVAAQHRGWTVRALNHNFERMPWGVEETWSCEIIGPRDLWSERHRFGGAESAFSWHIGTGAMGTAEALTSEGLVEQVRAIVDTLGIEALTEPKALAPVE